MWLKRRGDPGKTLMKIFGVGSRSGVATVLVPEPSAESHEYHLTGQRNAHLDTRARRFFLSVASTVSKSCLTCSRASSDMP